VSPQPEGPTSRTSSLNFIYLLKFPQCERSEPLFPLNFVLDFEEVCKNCSKLRIEEVDENCSKLQNCGGGFGSIFGRNFTLFFGLHFCTLFGQIFARDLLVLRDFFDFEVPFRPVLGPLLGRTFEHDFWHSRVCPVHGLCLQPQLACGP
jgi:hypothetical protein